MTLRDFAAQVQRLLEHNGGRHADDTVVLHTSNPAMGNRYSVPITGLAAGFDWSSGQTILHTGDIELLALPDGGTPPCRKFEDVEVVAADIRKYAAATLLLKHRGGFVGDNLRTQLHPGDRLRLIKLPAPQPRPAQPTPA